MATLEGKTCIGCVHFILEVGSPGYSEYTPGTDFDMSCAKRVWNYKGVNDSESGYRKCLLSAQNCKHYKLNPELEKGR